MQEKGQGLYKNNPYEKKEFLHWEGAQGEERGGGGRGAEAKEEEEERGGRGEWC